MVRPGGGGVSPQHPSPFLYQDMQASHRADMIVTVLVYNRYNTYGFQGAKSLILTTNSWVGGKNVFLGSVYIVIGGLAWLAAASLFITYNLGVFGPERRREGGPRLRHG